MISINEKFLEEEIALYNKRMEEAQEEIKKLKRLITEQETNYIGAKLYRDRVIEKLKSIQCNKLDR